jgi:hypothetical protein
MTEQNLSSPYPIKKSSFKKAIQFGSRYIDYRMGIYGAIIMGAIVFVINYSATEQWLPSSTAALKQGSYTFIFGGLIMRFCEYLAIKIKKQTIAILASVIIPTSIALTLTFGLHNLKGTPEPLASTIPTLMIIPATAVVGYRKRKQSEIRNDLKVQG